MAITVKMPQLGESVTEGTIGTWLVEPGQQVNKFDSLVEVITDKVTAEVPSPASGTVGEILAPEGQRLSVGEPICTLDGDGEEAAEEAPESAPPLAAAETAPLAQPRSGPANSIPVGAPSAPIAAAPAPKLASPGTQAPAPAAGSPQNDFISPAVRALAAENSVDLSLVQGTGFQGRITKRDVMIHLERGAAPTVAPGASAAPGRLAVPAASPQPGERIPLSPMRRSIAEHMVRSRQTSPHAWTMVEVDMGGVAALRATRKPEFKSVTGVDLTFLHFAIKGVCLALRAVPSMNAALEGDEIVLRSELNLGLAVAVPDGLVVPVLKGADRYSIAGLAQLSQDLIERARDGKLRLEDVEGGSFTLNNAGALGTVMSQAIINQPQAGILVMDAVIKRPVVIADAIAIRPMMNLCLSFDHRINDGAGAARLLGAVKGWLEGVGEETSLF